MFFATPLPDANGLLADLELGGRLSRGAVAGPEATTPDANWRFGACTVRPACREIVVAGQQRYLQPRPFDLLVHLMENRHRVVTADELLDAVWGDQEVQPGALTMAIARVRAVLQGALDEGSEIIRTYHRVGSRFVAALGGETGAR